MNTELTVEQLDKALNDYNEYYIVNDYYPYVWCVNTSEDVESTDIYDNESYKEQFYWITTYDQDHSIN